MKNELSPVSLVHQLSSKLLPRLKHQRFA